MSWATKPFQVLRKLYFRRRICYYGHTSNSSNGQPGQDIVDGQERIVDRKIELWAKEANYVLRHTHTHTRMHTHRIFSPLDRLYCGVWITLANIHPSSGWPWHLSILIPSFHCGFSAATEMQCILRKLANATFWLICCRTNSIMCVNKPGNSNCNAITLNCSTMQICSSTNTT